MGGPLYIGITGPVCLRIGGPVWIGMGGRIASEYAREVQIRGYVGSQVSFPKVYAEQF